ncbi:hypothetical protein ACFOTA_22375 [Chitinophaga sp. GCM10012297]|uniref:hypothetical protein n=1 Tax=Chitinophaga TaxID=79328 RepID=UPI001F323192|nr:hypothetical protein [Chitinophaga chungangae]
MKFHYIILVLPLIFACNRVSQKTTADSSIVDGVKELVPVAPPPAIDPENAQVQAQDTLFEDGTIPSSWANAGFDDPEGFKQFVWRFKDWVKNDRQDSIAQHIKFPLRQYKTESAFREHYVHIFDASLKAAVDTQRLDRIFRNAQGATIGNGRIWFAPLPEGYRIIAINP